MFLDIDYVHDMQMFCLIRRSDDTELLVVLEMLNFIENPDIASISQTNEEYYKECHYLDPSDLEQIVHPQALSPLQEEIHTISKADYHGRARRNSKASCTIAQSLPNLCVVLV